MEGLRFQTAAPPVRSDPARSDIACFVGFIRPRAGGPAQRARLERVLGELGWAHPNGDPLPDGGRVLPADVLPSGSSRMAFAQWLGDLGWRPALSAVAGVDLFHRVAARLLTESLADWWVEHDWLSPFASRSAADLLELVDVPVPVDAWDAFDALFLWDRRASSDGARIFDTTLGAAVQRFFAHGGRKCYVVRVADPWAPAARMVEREPLRARMLHPFVDPTIVDRTTWRGVAHVLGLPDVSFLCTPDLPELFAEDMPAPAPEPPGARVEERFVECAEPAAAAAAFESVPALTPPRCGERAFVAWSTFVTRIGGLLSRWRREAQFVAAVPLPLQSPGITMQWQAVSSIQTAFVQLAYPWLRTRDSARLPGGVEPPDGTLAGMLAGSALTNGAWRSVARQPVRGILSLEPLLSPSDLERPLLYRGSDATRRTERRLRDRISMFSPSPTGFQLLSDVTTDDDEAYRPANVNRLVASLVRAAYVIGEGAVFTNNGEQTWRRLRSAFEEVLLGLWGEGALAGATSAEAFEVRCDRSTMTRSDLDAGRALVRVQFTAASPIDQITVVFAMDEGGQVSLVSSQDDEAVPA